MTSVKRSVTIKFVKAKALWGNSKRLYCADTRQNIIWRMEKCGAMGLMEETHCIRTFFIKSIFLFRVIFGFTENKLYETGICFLPGTCRVKVRRKMCRSLFAGGNRNGGKFIYDRGDYGGFKRTGIRSLVFDWLRRVLQGPKMQEIS